MDIAELRARLGPVGVWAGPLQQLTADGVRRAVQEIEELGFGSYWYPESFGREAFSQAAFLLSATERLMVGSGIANLYARDAVAMANGGRTLEEAWPGRFILGVGVSHRPSVENRGHSYTGPVATMRTYLEGMRAAPWPPGDPRQATPPIVLAALGPKMLDLARDESAGAHPYFVPVEHTRLARAALGPDRLLVPEQAVVLATDRAAARAVGDAHLAGYLRLDNYRRNLVRLGWRDSDLELPGSDALFDAIVAWGDEAAVSDRVAQHHRAGADSVLLQALGDDPMTTLRRLAPLARG